ncbi:UDP-N-acetylglucosamine 2-epimerase [Saccharomonospora sp. NPDC046836]|uniref:UDP-N-acetylglucosamine 2-epimerase n=1 Tax=Saccharomonospora sp. NPDC046836 TaxID=3156921 RepID=UPI003402F7A2
MVISVVSPSLRRVCVFTGSRADYGPTSPLIRRLADEPGIDLRLLVSGGHLVPSQGMTVEAIKADGLQTAEEVDIALARSSPTATSKSFGLACIGLADALDRLSPEVLVLPGDRYEALAMAVVAVQSLVPIVHLGGGQLTYGSVDERMRHAISKLADVHFVAADVDRQRLINMGEDPATIFHIPFLGVDPKVLGNLLDKEELEDLIRSEIRSPLFLVTMHPVTADPAKSRESIAAVLEALADLRHVNVVFTAPNSDSGGAAVMADIEEWIAGERQRATFIPSLGQLGYLSLVRHADLVVGNSSSGLTEAPILGTPTVNIGSRQDGRPRAPSVVDCRELSSAGVKKAIQRALSIGSGISTVDISIPDAWAGIELMSNVLTSFDFASHRTKKFYEK